MTPTPCLVRPAEDYVLLIDQGIALANRGQQTVQSGLEDYRQAGEVFRRAKALAGHGRWLAQLKERGFRQQRANECMRLARQWHKLPPGGDLTLKAALRDLKALAWDEKRSLHQQRRQEQVGQLTGPLGIHTGDFREVGHQVADNSVDLIFTDPPYAADALGLYEDVARFAARVLIPSGICAVYTGKLYLPQVLINLGRHLDYCWVLDQRQDYGGGIGLRENFYEWWKPIVLYHKPPWDRLWKPFPDTVRGPREKDEHDWQQPLAAAEYVIGHLCPEGGLVCDPMCGSGTSGIAAARLGRSYVAYEVDATTADRARARMADEGQFRNIR
jgi:hypothetical protein